MFIIKERNGILPFLGVSKKGMFTMYALILLQFILIYFTVFYDRITFQMKFRNNTTLHYCELYAINFVKNEFINYDESDKMISYEEYNVDLDYEGITCTLSFYNENVLIFQSYLEWDDIENVICDYAYL